MFIISTTESFLLSVCLSFVQASKLNYLITSQHAGRHRQLFSQRCEPCEATHLSHQPLTPLILHTQLMSSVKKIWHLQKQKKNRIISHSPYLLTSFKPASYKLTKAYCINAKYWLHFYH